MSDEKHRFNAAYAMEAASKQGAPDAIIAEVIVKTRVVLGRACESQMIKGILAAIVLLLAVTSAAVAKDWTSASKRDDGSVFIFRGLKLGDPLPTRFARAPRTLQLHDTYCSKDQSSILNCYDAVGDRAPGQKRYPDSPWLGDVNVLQIIYRFYDGKFCGFYITFAQEHFGTLLTMMESKYGKPHERHDGTVQNRMGALFATSWAVWHTPYGAMKIERRGEDLTSGRISLLDIKTAQLIDSREKAAAEKKGKSAF